MSALDKHIIKGAMFQTLVVFIAISQHNVLTLCNTSLYFANEDAMNSNEQLELAVDVMLSLSECVMQVGLCLSVNKAL